MLVSLDDLELEDLVEILTEVANTKWSSDRPSDQKENWWLGNQWGPPHGARSSCFDGLHSMMRSREDDGSWMDDDGH